MKHEGSPQLDTPPRSREQAALDIAKRAIGEAVELLGPVHAELDDQILRQQTACDQTLNTGAAPRLNGKPYKVNLSARDWRHFDQALAIVEKAQRDIAELLPEKARS
jgi:hypothetical protein